GQDVTLSDEQYERLAQPDGFVLLRAAAGLRRIHWLPRALETHWQPELHRRLAISSWVLPPGQLVEQADGAWAIFEATGDWIVPWTLPPHDPLEDLTRLLKYAESLAGVLEELHRLQLVWLLFNPTELERGPDKQWRITNLDLRVFPFQQCPDQVR